MHGLKMPDLLPVLRLETHDRFGEEIVSLSSPAIPVVAGRAHGKVDEPAAVVDAERRPNVRVAGGLPRFVRPRFRALVPRIPRRRAEAPDALSTFHIEGL